MAGRGKRTARHSHFLVCPLPGINSYTRESPFFTAKLLAMRILGICLLSLACGTLSAQPSAPVSPFDGSHWGVVIDYPGMDRVTVKRDIVFHAASDHQLHFDVYLPANMKRNEKYPAVVLMNGVGDQPGFPPQRSATPYVSWSRLLAANGFVTLAMESEPNNQQQSYEYLFAFLQKNGAQYNIDTDRLGVQAFSANCREVVTYLMGERAFKGIKAATLYYGEQPATPYRADLPVLFVVAGFDVRGTNYANLWANVTKQNAPWTIAFGPSLPHAFDHFSDTDESRRLIMTTLAYWAAQLNPSPPRTTPFSREREIVAARYNPDQQQFLQLMRTWMQEHPNTTDSYALSMFATALIDNNLFADASPVLARSIALDPGNKGNYLNMALTHYALGRRQEAEQQIRLHEEGSTPESFTYWYIANRLIGISKYGDAVQLFERALTFPDQPPFVYYNVAMCYAMLGNKEKALTHLQVAVDKGFTTKEQLETENRFSSLRGDNRWTKMLSQVQ